VLSALMDQHHNHSDVNNTCHNNKYKFLRIFLALLTTYTALVDSHTLMWQEGVVTSINQLTEFMENIFGEFVHELCIKQGIMN